MNASELVALVRAGAKFDKGKLADRSPAPFAPLRSARRRTVGRGLAPPIPCPCKPPDGIQPALTTTDSARAFIDQVRVADIEACRGQHHTAPGILQRRVQQFKGEIEPSNVRVTA